MSENSNSCGCIIAALLGVLFTTVGTCLVIFWGLPTLRKAKASQEWAVGFRCRQSFGSDFQPR